MIKHFSQLLLLLLFTMRPEAQRIECLCNEDNCDQQSRPKKQDDSKQGQPGKKGNFPRKPMTHIG